MAQQPHITQAVKADLDMQKVEAAGLAASQQCLARIRSGFMRSLASGGKLKFSAQAELLNHMVPVMSKTLAFGYLMGQRRALLNWREAGIEPIALDRFSEVQKMIRDAGLGREMTRVQRGYARRVYAMMRDAGAKIDAVTRATVSNLIATNEPMGRGSEILQATLNRLGVGDYSQSQIETIYATEVARRYHGGRRQMDMRRWGDIWGFRYVTMRDDRVRPTHASWEGTVLKKGNRFWKTHYPPCGWRCRCQIVTIYKTPGYKPREVPPGKINGQVARADDGFGDNWDASIALSLLTA